MSKFITFEGCEGVGKSWHIKKLSEYLTKTGIDFIMTREPGGSGVAEKIRNIILSAENKEMTDLCELLLYSAARAQHIEDIIKPALNQGKLVICDRYIDSTYAYQGVARGLGTDLVKKVNEISAGEYIPELTIFLDFPPEKAFIRKGGADKGDRLEQMNLDFHKKVYQGYNELKSLNRFVAIDASGTHDETHKKIIEALKSAGVI